jgi:coenzyme PQQ synthesis protein D (PqqD)
VTNQSSDFSFSLRPEAAASFHDDGVVILHSGRGRLFSSNQTGARIWRGVEQRRSLESIVEELSGEYQIARTTARVHTLNFLAALERQELIQMEVSS